ncbi:hypothetical protein LDENG_00088730 [Lucifuga dentata]|nr:hypothetical protein LDENG_00088730 [Lucifuga dentata]
MWFSTCCLYIRFSFCCHSFLLHGSNDAMTRKGSTFIFVTLIYFDTIETTSCLEFLSEQ